jgi:hypothetical protein
MAKRCTAVVALSTSIAQSSGTITKLKASAAQVTTIRSARSISPPLAVKPSDSALALS